MDDDATSASEHHPMTAMAWAVAVLGPLAASGVMVALRSEIVPANAALVLVLPVMAAAIVGGRLGGAVSAVIAAASFDFFFTRPYSSFTIASRDDVETMVVLLAVGLVVAELVVRTRRSEQVARSSRREVTQIRRISAVAAGGEAPGRLIDLVRREVVEVLAARGARFEGPPFSTVLPQLGHGRVLLPAAPTRTASAPGPRNEIAVPVWGEGHEIGRLVVVFPEDVHGIVISPEARALTVALADQLGAALHAAR